MLPEDAIAAAEEEGLDLVRADGSPTGFWCVRQRGNRFVAAPSVSGENSSRHLGMFDSAEEAALAIARWIRNTGATPSARKARKLEHTAAPTISLEEATAQAAAEGLTFLVDASNPTGFRGVYKSNSAVRGSASGPSTMLLSESASRLNGTFSARIRGWDLSIKPVSADPVNVTTS